MEKDKWGLIAMQLTGELKKEEESQFQDWLAENEANVELLNKAKEIWNNEQQLKKLDEQAFLRAIDSDPTAVWTDIEKKIKETPSHSLPVRWAMRIAASVILIIGLGWLWNSLPNHSETLVGLEMAYGGEAPKELLLADGSKVWLNDGASLAYTKSFDGDTRTVHLKGEGYFDIARDENKPFIIQMDESVVQVLGTSFNLAAGDATVPTQVTVTSGKVSLTGNKDKEQSIFLTKGEAGIYDPTNGQLTEAVNDDPNFLAWKTGILKFDNQKLSSVINNISAHYQTTIDLANEEVAKSPLTATFDNQSIEEVLAVIVAVHGLQIERQQNGFVLTQNITKTQN